MEPITKIVDILKPSEIKTSESVGESLEKYLQEIQKSYTENGDDEMLKVVLSYSKGFWKGLFTCYDNLHVPRTNNDLERFFRKTKTRHRRMTGLRNWNEYILRNGEYIVLVDDAIKQNNVIQRLAKVPFHEYQKEQKAWSIRLSESIKRKRFRKNPKNYLQELESNFKS